MKGLNETRTAYAVKMAKFDHDAFQLITNDEGLKQGLLVYEENCLSCHEENGKGDIGPNLTDAYWLNAKGTPETIYEVVINGREDKGMPTWREDLSKEEILTVVHYLMSIKDTNVADGKEPQGELIN
jgi:cytochrome c oxidase cbb3-type subunit 3